MTMSMRQPGFEVACLAWRVAMELAPIVEADASVDCRVNPCGLCKRRDARAERKARKRSLRPRRPCSPGCPGWGVFEVGGGRYEVQRCDCCWMGARNAPEDEDFGDPRQQWIPAVIEVAGWQD